MQHLLTNFRQIHHRCRPWQNKSIECFLLTIAVLQSVIGSFINNDRATLEPIRNPNNFEFQRIVSFVFSGSPDGTKRSQHDQNVLTKPHGYDFEK